MRYLGNFKLAIILLLAMSFGSIFLGSISQRDMAFAQDAVAAKDYLKKEELKLEVKPSLNGIGQNGNGKQEIAVPENMLSQKTHLMAPPPEKSVAESSAKFSLNVKKDVEKSNLKSKKTFKREIGLTSVGTAKTESWGLLSIDDCIEIAVENHLPLQIAKKSIKLAEMRVFEARRNMLPSATLGYEEYDGKINGRRYVGRKQYIEGQQPLFRGGELYFTMKQATTNLEIVKNDYEKTRNELVLQVKKGYYSLAKAVENLKMQKELGQEVEKTYDMVSKETEAGIATKLEFLNVSSQASQVKFQLASAVGDVQVAELILKQAMNIDVKETFEINPSLEFKKVEIDFDNALHAAFMNRPEVKINTLMVDYYNYGKGIARAKGLIKVDFLSSWGLAKEEFVPADFSLQPGFEDINQKLQQQWYAGVKASMPFWGSTAEYTWTKEVWTPVVSAFHGTEDVNRVLKVKLFDKLDVYSEAQLSDIDFDRARQELNKIKQDITLEVRENCFSYEKALIQLETATNKVKYQEKDLEFTKMKRGLDEVQDSNVIESMIKMAQEKFGYVQALTDCHTSIASINKAIGIEDYFKDEKESP